MQQGRTHRRFTVVALLLGVFMAAMEMTVVSTAMPTVIAELGGFGAYTWVFTAYMLASTVTVPIWGKLADLYGRKPLLQLALAVFVIGSAASGLAGGMYALVAARCVQGIGAGGLQPVAQTILGDLFEPHDRARVQGAVGGIWGTAGLVGPVVGGWIVDRWSWRWVFFINVPAGVAAMLVLAASFHEQVTRRRHELDYAGALLLTIAVLATLGAVTFGTLRIGIPLALGATAGLVWVERTASEPILPLRMLRHPVVATASVAGALLGAAMMTTATYVPLLVRAVLGGTTTEAGMAIAPMAVGWPLASVTVGKLLPRTGYRPLIRTGFVVALLATLLLASTVGSHGSVHGPRIASFLLGVGLGFANTTLLLAVQSTVQWEERGVATASTSLARTLGGTLGVGLLGATLTAGLATRAGVSETAAAALLGPTHGRDLPSEVAMRLLAALAQGLGRIFWIIAGLAALAFACGLFFPRMQMPRSTSMQPGKAH